MLDRIKKQVKKKESFLNTLEEMDRTGKFRKAKYKERISFTIDADIIIKFRKYCEKNSISMSGKIESWIKEFLNKNS